MKYSNFNKKHSIGAFISTAVAVVGYIHILHFNESVYSRHVILNEFYDELQDLIDTFAEAWSADNGPVPFELPKTSASTPEEIIQGLYEMSVSIHPDLDIALQNPLEDIMTHCKQTLYKLRKLK
ncbi:MAG: hypothetical protein [Caudoviricetes sp.]|nr:MAG: hypothetical protein [Caudoviricetes sp.]